jgi:hypothetical protein
VNKCLDSTSQCDRQALQIRDADYTLLYETGWKCEKHLSQFSSNRISLSHREYYMFLQKRRIDITFRGNASLWWESPVTPMIHAGIAMCMLQARRKLCLKFEQCEGVNDRLNISHFLLFVLLITAYGRNSCDQPIRSLTTQIHVLSPSTTPAHET